MADSETKLLRVSVYIKAELRSFDRAELIFQLEISAQSLQRFHFDMATEFFGRAWRSSSSLLNRVKPYVAMISLQFGYAGMNIISMVSLKQGLSNYTLVVYRHLVATLVMAPFAIVLERKVRPKITFRIFLQMFVLGLLGPVIDQNLYYMGMKYTSTTFTSAMCNVLPAMTFVMAIICRMEKVKIKKFKSQAKIIGTLVTCAGAMIMTLYKGRIVDMVWSSGNHHEGSAGTKKSTNSDDTDWVKGAIMVIIACFSWAGFFVLQAFTLRKYTAQLSLTAIICFIGTLQGAALTLIMERGSSVWVIGWDNRLLTVVYSGTVCSGIAYYVQGLVMRQRGPVFATAFSPLFMVFQVFLSSIILHESIYLGGIIGGIVIVVGLYTVLWGKSMDHVKKLPTLVATESDAEIQAASDNLGKVKAAGKEVSIEIPSAEKPVCCNACVITGRN